ncbi:hypothetical protein J6O48_05450 [bacterium]|nr:hypothetical protein [bacterium]
MKKERDQRMKLITKESTELNPSEVKLTEPIEDKVYQSDPIKSDLYSKLLAYRQSQKKFTIKDLIRDNLK